MSVSAQCENEYSIMYQKSMRMYQNWYCKSINVSTFGCYINKKTPFTLDLHKF